MKNSKFQIFVIMILIGVFLGLYVADSVEYDRQGEEGHNVKMNIHSNHDEDIGNVNYNMQDLTHIPQCFWGTWVMTAQLHGQDGWVKCRSDFQDLTVKFTPTTFFFQDEYREVSTYSCEIVGIEDIDGYFREAGQFRNFGLNGNYFLKFSPDWDNGDYIGHLWEYIVVSETELIIPEARNGMYKMIKVEEYSNIVDETDYLNIIPYHGICYGVWEVTERYGNPCQSVDIGYKLGTWGKTGSFEYCRILDRNEKAVDSFAKLIGLGNGNKYLIYCKFSENYFWDYMVIKDGMTAVLVNGDCIYQVKRISDPEKDGIYEEFF